ncbi:MAG: alpha/beta hydrolase [Candidatus Kapabacteria bacterium]|jgi:pimeloyl-ACP methyl ester carboxylesterase|nr:alpha/beta hydrolase [Candidatus Kapabacteria bacterium]
MEIIDGRYVGSGQKNLYVKELGSGSPTIVIETGWAGLSAEWADIQKTLSEKATVITYDRAGYGESPAMKGNRSGEVIAQELYAMLTNGNFHEPFIFVAQDAGALYIRQFAKMYPNDVAGVVFVDPVTEENDSFDELDVPTYQEIASLTSRMENLRGYPEMDKEEFTDLVVPMLEELYRDAPEVYKQQMISYQSDQKFYAAILAEFDARGETFAQLHNYDDFPDVPITVIIHDYKVMIEVAAQFGVDEQESKLTEELWLKLARNMLKLSDDNDFILARNSTHSVHLSRSDVVVSAVEDMINRIEPAQD